MCDVLWSDPEVIIGWRVSPRGARYIFGGNITKEFNKTNECSKLFDIGNQDSILILELADNLGKKFKIFFAANVEQRGSIGDILIIFYDTGSFKIEKDYLIRSSSLFFFNRIQQNL
ncbi:unnamed protein product [Paramecium sonneborni]|uniref:Uncharacterized protein n=1 Tax=Paramecium sonneborni TaxID=65129 RepID=A0A8S1RDU4_9CILI|nr:unnamed protein product [Paramecium sonneborni]